MNLRTLILVVVLAVATSLAITSVLEVVRDLSH
jgi:hypothetical protein